MSNHSRRKFLKAVGSAAGTAALVSGPASAGEGGQSNARFIIDLQEVSRSEIPDDVEITHDISQIDLLGARGDPDAVPGAASTTPDVTAYQDGPVANVEAASTEDKGPAWDSGTTNTELQWDKREQRVGDLTERPDERRVVHDTTTGEGTRIAVVDTGVSDAHPDLADVVNAELSANYTIDDYDFRPNGAGYHGTHVAGTIAATNTNGEGVLGTAPDTEIVSHRVFSDPDLGDDEGGASTAATIAALADAADKGCDAANFSVGYPPANPEEDAWVAPIKEAYRRLAEYAHANDMLIVNSAGNASVDMTPDEVISLPTEVEGIFGVSATGPIGYLWDDDQAGREDKSLKTLEDPTDSPAYYTNYGEGTDISAHGGDVDLEAADEGVPGWYYDMVFSCYIEEAGDSVYTGYSWAAGTSMAAPQVSGAVALVRSLQPDASSEEVASLLRETADDNAPGGELYHGDGHLDLRRLIREAQK